MKKNKLIVVGVGTIGQELLKKLPKDLEITCIDIDPAASEKATGIRADLQTITGDATSRLVLEQSGAGEADGVIITTTTEKVNIEVARLLKEHFDAKRTIAVGSTKPGMEELESLGVEVENIFTASAISIRNRLEQKSRAAHAIGLGKNEIFEVEVHPNSRLANRKLSSLTPLRWRIGIIYRDENIIIPRHDTVLKPRDRVIILGDPAVIKTVSDILTFKFQQFPLEYGSYVAVHISGNEEEQVLPEVDYLFSVFPLSKVYFFLTKRAAAGSSLAGGNHKFDNIQDYEVRTTDKSLVRAIGSIFDERKADLGMIILPRSVVGPRSRTFFSLDARKKNLLSDLIKNYRCPILLSAGSFPYERAAVPCVSRTGLQHSLETALEISSALSNQVGALLVSPSVYISSDDDMKAFEEMKKTVNDVALMYKLSVQKNVLQGNPVVAMLEALKDYDLLVADVGSWAVKKRFPLFLNPDVTWHIVRKASISCLLLPSVGESL